MGTTLQHGIFLPAEGERNCYAGLASNWTILDGVVGGYSSHAANTTIHVTAEDKAKWDAVTSKADASALTAHTGNTTIHVTAEDKAKWDAVTSKADASALTAHTGNTTIHVTAEDKTKWDAVTSKANDADVMHKSGAESIAGQKTFSDNTFFTANVYHKYTSYESGNIPANNLVSNVYLADKNNVYVGCLRNVIYTSGRTSTEIRAKNIIKNGVLDPTGDDISSNLNVEVQPNGAKTIYWDGLIRNDIIPFTTNNNSLGTTSNKWKTFNGVEPSSLSLPSGNVSDVIDISGYLTYLDGTNNPYTAPANGWVTIAVGNCTTISCIITGYWSDNRIRTTSGNLRMMFPILKNQVVKIQIIGGTIDYARFFPCKGNI